MGSELAKSRSANWDLLRSLAMFFVAAVHSTGYLGAIHGIETQLISVPFFLICDPVFFALSGYFALRPLKRSLKDYYLNKVATILLPLVLYSVLLYLYSTQLVDMSVDGYFLYFRDLLWGGWWFIPVLVPCLVAAPFLAKGLEALDDKQLALLGIILAGLFAFGEIAATLQWLFARLGIESLAALCELATALVPPSVLSSSPQYFQYFILGGIFWRLAPRLRGRLGTMLMVGGLICWVLDVLWNVFGMPRIDPSYFWFFATFGIMVLFDRIDIKSKVACRAIVWTAKRSYSIYLVQYTTITVTATAIYSGAFAVAVPEMAAILRVVIWAGMLACAYLLAWGVASVVDCLLLERLQKLFKRVFMRS